MAQMPWGLGWCGGADEQLGSVGFLGHVVVLVQPVHAGEHRPESYESCHQVHGPAGVGEASTEVVSTGVHECSPYCYEEARKHNEQIDQNASDPWDSHVVVPPKYIKARHCFACKGSGICYNFRT